MLLRMLCPFCDEEPLWDLSLGPGNQVEAIFCCETLREVVSHDPEALRMLLEEEAGVSGKAVVDTGWDWVLHFGLETGPVRQKVAQEFIRTHHRHNPPPPGWKYGFGLYNGPLLVGVCWVGRPVNRVLDDGATLEVNRLCVRTDVAPELARHACSKGYGEAARRARKLGFSRILTYTLESEPGTSLRGAGWDAVAQTKGGSWNCPSRPRTDKAPTCRKVRWERALRGGAFQGGPAPSKN